MMEPVKSNFKMDGMFPAQMGQPHSVQGNNLRDVSLRCK
jgi:hypothetical protein